MKINIVMLGEMYLGMVYSITFIDGSQAMGVFTGVNYSPHDKSYWVHFVHGVAGDVGYKLGDIVIADLVE